jgi:hypothetical protein
MTIKGDGNVGIGTSDPKTLLDVNGKALIHKANTGGAPANGLYGNDGTRLILWPGAVDNVAYSMGITGGTLWYAVPTEAIHAFYVGTTERLRINASGNVGIGTNDPGTNKLYVNGTTYLNGALTFKTDIWNTSTDSINRFYFANNSTTYIVSGGAAGDNGFVVYS